MTVYSAAADGEVIWEPGSEDLADSGVERFRAYLTGQGLDVGTEYGALWRWSVDNIDAFWSHFASFAGVELGGAPDVIYTSGPMPDTRWFTGTTTNFARNLLEGRDGTAIIAVPESGEPTKLSWSELRRQVASFAAHLRDVGVEQGDRVVAVLPNIPETVVAFLATASIGAVWSVCAPEFGPGAIISRFAQLEPKVLIAAPGYRLSGIERDRTVELTEVLQGLGTVQHVVWVTGHCDTGPFATNVQTAAWEVACGENVELEWAEVEFNEPLWVLFSSGTTGIPKGIVHSHGGALLEILKMLIIHSDLRPGDCYFNVASTSWVLWNSLVGALGVGATAVLVDGNPTYPSIDRVWKVASSTSTAVLGVSAGFIHACAKADLKPGESHDLGKLRCVQVTGSPLSGDGYRWVYQSVGDVWLSSMSGGTDIASIFVGGVPTLPVRVGRIQAPALGVRVEAWDESGAPTDGKGELVVTAPMPSMPLSLWGDATGERYASSYFDVFPGVWRHGDFIEFTPEGIVIHGRSDSTLNRNGLRLGSADIYSVVEALPEVREALVVGAELSAEDYYMPLFVHLADGVSAEHAEAAIVAAIRTNLSVRYLPDEIVAMPGIPHTRTGKKLEVPVKRMLQGAELHDVVDIGAVDDPGIIRAYAEFSTARTDK